MRITMIGCGHLGATHAAAMAEIGHEVLGVDRDPAKVAALNSGRAWFHEPGLDELLGRHLGTRLRFSTDIAEAAAHGEVHFLGVGTPESADGRGYDLSQLHAAVDALAPHLRERCLVVGKSTVAVGTAAALAARIAALAPAGAEAELAWSPEFLRQGHALEGTLRPDRIVAGVSSPWAEKMVREVFAPIADAGTPIIVTDLATAEVVKGAANAFLATKISFINAVARLCEQAGADATAVAAALGHDRRIGPGSLAPGLGYGGGCLPKDVRAFHTRAEELGVGESFAFLHGVEWVNRERRARTVELIANALGGSLSGRRIALWGAAFTPGTDDVRDSPALAVADRLHELGAVVTAYDPMAVATARAARPDLTFVDDPLVAARQAEVVVLATEWPQLRALDPARVAEVVATPVLVDARAVLPAADWRAAGWVVHRLGGG